MTALLEQYEQQYAVLIAEMTAQISRLQFTDTTMEQRELGTKIDTSMSEATELLEQMGLELHDLTTAQRASFTTKLNVAQAELKRLQTDLRNAKESHRKQHTAIELNGGAGGDDDETYYEDVSITNDQRQRLLDNSERIERTGNRLTDGYRVALETEALGAQVLNDLNHQRETIQTTRSRMRETNADLGRTSRTLNSMMLRAMREKVVLYGIGICFVLAVGISLYLTFSSATPSA